MKSRTLIIIGGSLLLLIILRSFFGGDKEAETEIPLRTAKIVQTEIVGKSSFTEQIHVTGRVAPIRETIVSTQWTGFIGSIAVKMGDSVLAGQMLASIADTYGLSGNAIDEAQLGFTSAGLSRDNTLVSLNQSLENARVAYEKAKKDYDASKLSDGKSTTISKAELDLQNYITTQEKTLEWYETSYESQVKTFLSFIANVIDTSDTIIWVSDGKKGANDSYEYLLSVTDPQKKIIAAQSLADLLIYRNWQPDKKLSLTDRVTELQKAYNIGNNVLNDVENVLNNSLTDTSNFTAATLASQKALIDASQAQYNTISASLVSFLNNAQSFLATYEKDRLSRELGVETTAENNLNALNLAQKAYETAQKARDIADAQWDISLGTASLRLDNATGNAAKMAITAPFSGVIIAKNAEIGSLASPGINLFTIGDTSSLIIKTDISVEQKKYIKIGQDISFSDGNEIFVGRLSSLWAGPDPQNHLYRAEITLPKSVKLTLGDIVDVMLPGAPLSKNPNDTHIVVPYSALKNLGQETYAVYIVTIDDAAERTGIAHERIVKIGESNENSVTILEGLEVWEHIITLWTLGVEDGDYVQEPELAPATDEEKKEVESRQAIEPS